RPPDFPRTKFWRNGFLIGEGQCRIDFGSFTLLSRAGLLLATSVNIFAAEHCEKRIRNAEMQLERAVQRHGPHSRQAEKKRPHLEEVQATCHWR
ncbi:MAG TPA: hypothetical protein VG498_14250, partial [Terriglobales bacterium]|nr:hypothetical protein [Terriglobales bacterium]